MTSKVLKTNCEKKVYKKKYFGQEEENAIIEFIKETDPDKKNNIFIKRIMPAFKELIMNLIKVYKVGTIENDIDSVKREALSYMFIKLSRGNFEGGVHKAFSYFNVVARNFFFQRYKDHNKRFETELGEDEISEDKELYSAQDYRWFRGLDDKDSSDKMADEESLDEFMESIYSFKNKLTTIVPTLYPKKDLTSIDIIITKYSVVLDAMYELFNRREALPSFKKKVIYFYLREISKEDSKTITKVIDLLKQHYPQMSEAFTK